MKVSESGSEIEDFRSSSRTIGVKERLGAGGDGDGDSSRMITVKERNGGEGLEGKRVAEREGSVAEKRWVRCSNTAI